ncbi:putative pentatricopeptide repeat-containing protein-like [Capsicum annuum]|nr:putative pentatricopeptide repeat-containing protein-like [Capsicum annuum]KAF3672056.1 putative pentatricopeptide repeat-containing protein-like [Capsicum annuum]
MDDILPDPSIFKRLVGKLNFLQHSRPDISFAVQYLSQFLQAPCAAHMKADIHVLRYLLNAPYQGIFLPATSDFSICAYADSISFRRSVTGYYIVLGDCPVSWKSKKQPTIALSSAEAEYHALHKVVVEGAINKLRRKMMGFERLMVNLKTKLRRSFKMKESYDKIEKSESMRVEIRSKKARKLIEQTLKIADSPKSRSYPF